MIRFGSALLLTTFAAIAGAAPVDEKVLDDPIGQPYYITGLESATAERLASAHAMTVQQAAELTDAEARSDAWGRLGLLYHSQHLASAAEQAYGEAIRAKDSPRWRYLRATAMGERGEIVDAISDFRRATELDPAQMAAWYRLGASLLVRGDFDEADAAFRQALSLNSDAAIVLAGRGDVAAARGDLPTALERLTQAHALEPDAGQLAYKIAMIYRRMDNVVKAREWLERRGANNAKPQIDDPVLLEVAQMSQSGRFYVKAGEWALERGDLVQALAAFENAVALAPENAAAGLAYANALTESGRAGEALVETRRVLEFADESARAWYALAWFLRHSQSSDDQEEAGRAVRRSLELSEDAKTRSLAGGLAMRQGQFVQAAIDYAALAEQLPEEAYYHYWLGMAQLGAGDCRGLVGLDRAVKLRSSWGEAHVVLARVEAICGAPERALVRTAAVIKARNNEDTRITAAFMQLGTGHADKAEQLALAEMPHPDAQLVLDAIAIDSLPARPFALGSRWWLPPEVAR